MTLRRHPKICDMDLSSSVTFNKNKIESYGDRSFKINGKSFSGSVIISDKGTVNWNVSSISEIKLQDFSDIISNYDNLRTLLIGTGKYNQFPDRELIKNIREKNLGLEFMDTGSACRTFNVLIEENRDVVAALIAF